jgi:hypothetical protein
LNVSHSLERPERLIPAASTRCPQAHVAGVLEHVVTAMHKMLVELNRRQRSAQQAGQRLLAHLKRLGPQVVAIKL